MSKADLDGKVLVGTVSPTPATSTGQVMLLLDGAATAVPCWIDDGIFASGDRLSVIYVRGELYAICKRGPSTDSGWLQGADVGTVLGGHTLTGAIGRVKNGLASIDIRVTLTAAVAVTAATGNCTDTPILALNPDFQQSSPYVQGLSSSASTQLFGGFINNSQNVVVSHTAPSTTMPAGTLVSLSGTYIL